jgi:hypothetical protein
VADSGDYTCKVTDGAKTTSAASNSTTVSITKAEQNAPGSVTGDYAVSGTDAANSTTP